MIPITNTLFKKLVTEHLSLDLVFLLQRAVEGFDIRSFEEKKITLLIKTLKLKGFLGENSEVTASGKALWESLQHADSEELQLNKMEDTETEFDRFWKSYPGTDIIKVEGKLLFKGSRSLRNDRAGCLVKFHQILSEKIYTADDIIKALLYEVQLKIEKSIKTRENHLSYMKNSHAWLNQRSFEAFIEEARDVELKPLKKGTNWDAIA